MGKRPAITNPFASDAVWPSTVTTTFHGPGAAEAGSTKVHVIVVGETTATLLAGMVR